MSAATLDSVSSVALFRCEGCGRPRRLFALVNGRLCCAGCWRRAGSPFPRVVLTATQLHEIEVATRERMNRRGGADRHLVRAGKS